MQLRVGTWLAVVNGVKIDSHSEQMLQNGLIFGYKTILKISGFLEGSTQQDLSLQQIALRAALRTANASIALLHDDGSISATALSATSSATGVIVTDGPNFPYGDGDYATLKRFDFTAEATYLDAGAASLLIGFKESLEFSGGGPLYIMRPALVGPPQRQMVYQQTPYAVVQRGQATGLLAYPRYPSSLWPFAENPALRHTGATGPDRDAKLYKNWTTTWEYHHEWAAPLVGAPNVWI